MREDLAREPVRSLGSGAFDGGDRGDEAGRRKDDGNRGVGGDAERAVGVVFAGEMGVSELDGGAEEKQKQAEQPGQARVASSEAAKGAHAKFDYSVCREFAAAGGSGQTGTAGRVEGMPRGCGLAGTTPGLLWNGKAAGL